MFQRVTVQLKTVCNKLIIFLRRRMFDLDRQSHLEKKESLVRRQESFSISPSRLEQNRRPESVMGKAKGKQGESRLITGRWVLRESMKYYCFILIFEEHLQQAALTKKLDIFKTMSELIVTRSREQCKSHHLKLIRVHKTINGVLAHLWFDLKHLSEEWKRLYLSEPQIQLLFQPAKMQQLSPDQQIDLFISRIRFQRQQRPILSDY